MDISGILELLIRLLLAVAAAFVIPWVKTKVEADQLAKILSYVHIFVGAAEQLFDCAECDKKKEYVLGCLREKGLRADASAVDAMVESAVHALHRAAPAAAPRGQ